MRKTELADRRHDTAISLGGATIYLLAVLILGTALGSILGRGPVGGQGDASRLWPIFLVGEIVIYLLVLVVPGERVVPPGNALFGVLLGLATRALTAFLTATTLRLNLATEGMGALFVRAYVRHWLPALLQIFLVLLYLWLIRGALEIEQWQPHVRQAWEDEARRQRLEATAAEERRRRLLEALSEVREQRGAAPVAGAEAAPPSPEEIVEAQIVGGSDEASSVEGQPDQEQKSVGDLLAEARMDAAMPSAETGWPTPPAAHSENALGERRAEEPEPQVGPKCGTAAEREREGAALGVEEVRAPEQVARLAAIRSETPRAAVAPVHLEAASEQPPAPPREQTQTAEEEPGEDTAPLPPVLLAQAEQLALDIDGGAPQHENQERAESVEDGEAKG